MANVEIRRVGGANSSLSFPRPDSHPIVCNFNANELCVVGEDEWAAIKPFAEKQGIFKVGASKAKTTDLQKAQAIAAKRADRELGRHRPDLMPKKKAAKK